MANTEKVSDQIATIKDGWDNSNHSFMTRLMAGLQNRINEVVGEMPTIPTGKQAVIGQIKVNIVGSKVVADADGLDDHKQKVRQLMDVLKNPASLVELLGE